MRSSQNKDVTVETLSSEIGLEKAISKDTYGSFVKSVDAVEAISHNLSWHWDESGPRSLDNINELASADAESLLKIGDHEKYALGLTTVIWFMQNSPEYRSTLIEKLLDLERAGAAGITGLRERVDLAEAKQVTRSQLHKLECEYGSDYLAWKQEFEEPDLYDDFNDPEIVCVK